MQPNINQRPETHILEHESGYISFVDRLNSNLEGFHDRITKDIIAEHKLTETTTARLGIMVKRLTDMWVTAGFLKDSPKGPVRDNSVFLRILDEMGTPESKLVIQGLRQQTQILNKVSRRQMTQGKCLAANRRALDRDLQKKAEAGDDQLEFNIALRTVIGQLLEREDKCPCAPDERRSMIAEHKLIGRIYDKTALIVDRINAVSDDLDNLAIFEERLTALKPLFKGYHSAHSAQESAKAEMEKFEIGPEQSAKEMVTPEKEALEQESARLIERHGNLKGSMASNEKIIKTHFASNPRLIAAIPAVLKEMRLLCAGLVKAEIKEITSWELGIASQQWMALKDKLPSASALKKIDPEFIEQAIAFLIEQEDFLSAYNDIINDRILLVQLEQQIDDIRLKEDRMKLDFAQIDLSKQEHRKHLEINVSSAENELQKTLDGLLSGLNELGNRYGFEQDGRTPNDFWLQIEIKVCKDILEKSARELEDIEKLIDEGLNICREHLDIQDDGNVG
jgi:hypothetical protein